MAVPAVERMNVDIADDHTAGGERYDYPESANGASESVSKTTRTWENGNVTGHSIDPYTHQVDPTEGFGAFDLIARHSRLGPRHIDIGGGEHDFNKSYALRQKSVTEMHVYDPFMRSPEHNKEVEEIAKGQPFDSASSISVLNVIEDPVERRKHIQQVFNSIKNYGRAQFITWPGNGSGTPDHATGNFQRNAAIVEYLDEVRSVFGRNCVEYIENEQLIICRKIVDF
ncbi:MAG: hypothetical protein S4CHLAM37_10150 [Chlamydiia bacterium]|nr:hypothetical protein [Chlamydiia bacterium]